MRPPTIRDLLRTAAYALIPTTIALVLLAVYDDRDPTIGRYAIGIPVVWLVWTGLLMLIQMFWREARAMDRRRAERRKRYPWRNDGRPE